MGSQADAVAFVKAVNKSRKLQAHLLELGGRDFRGMRAIARSEGFDFDRSDFFNACLSREVDSFCHALVKVAGQLHTYKM